MILTKKIRIHYRKVSIAMVIASISVIMGCQEEDFYSKIGKIPPSDLCLSGFITPDSIFLVMSRSVPYNYPLDGQDPYLLKDTGLIWVEEDGVMFDTLRPILIAIQNPDGSPAHTYYYTTPRKPVEGRNYHIYAQYPGFNMVQATVHLPHMVPILQVDTVIFFKTEKTPIDPNFPFNGLKDTLIRYLSGTIRFKDPVNERNYYKFPLGYTVKHQPILSYSTQFDDSDINGQLVSLYFELYYEEGKNISIELISLDEAYFTYLQGTNLAPELSNYESMFYNYNHLIITYSNTSNRLGMVAGYVKSSVKLHLP